MVDIRVVMAKIKATWPDFAKDKDRAQKIEMMESWSAQLLDYTTEDILKAIDTAAVASKWPPKSAGDIAKFARGFNLFDAYTVNNCIEWGMKLDTSKQEQYRQWCANHPKEAERFGAERN